MLTYNDSHPGKESLHIWQVFFLLPYSAEKSHQSSPVLCSIMGRRPFCYSRPDAQGISEATPKSNFLTRQCCVNYLWDSSTLVVPEFWLLWIFSSNRGWSESLDVRTQTYENINLLHDEEPWTRHELGAVAHTSNPSTLMWVGGQCEIHGKSQSCDLAQTQVSKRCLS